MLHEYTIWFSFLYTRQTLVLRSGGGSPAPSCCPIVCLRVLASPLSCPQDVFLKAALQPLGYPAKVWPSAGLYQPCALSLFYILYKPLLSYQLSVSDCTWARRRSEWFWHIWDIILFSFPHLSLIPWVGVCSTCWGLLERKKAFF